MRAIGAERSKIGIVQHLRYAKSRKPKDGIADGAFLIGWMRVSHGLRLKIQFILCVISGLRCWISQTIDMPTMQSTVAFRTQFNQIILIKS